jgi:hypothetical protein
VTEAAPARTWQAATALLAASTAALAIALVVIGGGSDAAGGNLSTPTASDLLRFACAQLTVVSHEAAAATPGHGAQFTDATGRLGLVEAAAELAAQKDPSTRAVATSLEAPEKAVTVTYSVSGPSTVSAIRAAITACDHR